MITSDFERTKYSDKVACIFPSSYQLPMFRISLHIGLKLNTEELINFNLALSGRIIENRVLKSPSINIVKCFCALVIPVYNNSEDNKDCFDLGNMKYVFENSLP